MGPPAVTMLVLVVLSLTAILHHAEGSSIPDEEQDNQCSALEKRQSLLESRLTESELRLTTQLNTLQTDVNTRLNKMDSRLDGVLIAIADMKDSLQSQLTAMNKKVDEASRDCQSKQDVSTAQPDTTPQEVSSTAIPETTPLPVYRGCKDALAHGQNTSGVYTIAPDANSSYNVYCEQELDGGGWTVFQARKDGSVDFNQDWNTYKRGFGQLTAEFWLGNDLIHSLTKHHDQQLKIELVSPEGEVKYAPYDQFWIDDEAHKYNLTAKGYSGSTPPGNALRDNDGSSFTTKDQDNDAYGLSCSENYCGAWWYSWDCGYSNLNGLYGSTSGGDGINWADWKGFEVSMKATRMMFRKKS